MITKLKNKIIILFFLHYNYYNKLIILLVVKLNLKLKMSFANISQLIYYIYIYIYLYVCMCMYAYVSHCYAMIIIYYIKWIEVALAKKAIVIFFFLKLYFF